MHAYAPYRWIAPLSAFETRLVRDHAERPALLPRGEFELVRWAVSLARLSLVRHEAKDVDVFDGVAPFRHWLLDQLETTGDLSRPGASIDWRALRALVPSLRDRVERVRRTLVEHEVNHLPAERLEEEIRVKQIALVLGGGGGSGYCHLGVFSTLAELGIKPALCVGSSMGALMGLLRCIAVDYDPMLVAMAMPRPSEFGRVFSPYRGQNRWGFPGGLELKAQSIAREIFHNLLGTGVPRFNELPIPLRVIATGLRTGIGLALDDVERSIRDSNAGITPMRLRRRIALFTGVVGKMLASPRFLSEIVFGGDDNLRDFDTIDAVGFSCAVPGLIHYDIFREAPDSTATLRRLFEERQILRLTDGGVISNVPSRVARETIQSGELNTRNVFVLAFDAFAPQLNRNALFLPAQQLIRGGVTQQTAWADQTIVYRSPPSPVSLLQSIEQLEQIVTRVRAELRGERAFLSELVRPLPRWNELVS